MNNFFYFLLLFIKATFTDKIGNDSYSMLSCRHKMRLIGLDKDDQFEFVTVKLNTTLVLWCRYCKEGEKFTPKIWFTQSRLTNEPAKELQLGMGSTLSENRVYVKPDHTLVINGITVEDAALYYCHGPKNEEENYKYNYMVDVVPEHIPLRSGNIDDWMSYTSDISNEMNQKFEDSLENEYIAIRKIGVKVHIVFDSSRWGTCNGCLKIRRRFIECRLKTKIFNQNNEFDNSTSDSVTLKNPNDKIFNEEQRLLNSFKLSCHSLLFAKFFPNISSELMKIENYVVSELCYAPCQLAFGPSYVAKYRNNIILTEGDHLTLNCPEATMDNEVVWLQNGITIPSNSREGNIFVDSFNSLYISQATSAESGNYTCFVDNRKIQEIIVVVRISIASKAIVRHVQYLGFIFIFSLILYIAGLIISWTRRDSFKKINFEYTKNEVTRWDKEGFNEL